MGNGFDFTFVKKKCRFDQGFAVTGGAGKSNFCIFRKKAVNLLDGVDGGFQRVSVVTAVEGVKKSSVFAYQRGFCCGRTGVDPQEAFSLIGGKISGFYPVGTLTVMESLVVVLCGKKRLHTFYLKIQLDGGPHAFLQFSQGNGNILLCIQGGADGCEQMRVVWCDNMFIIQLQGSDKSSLQLRKEVKRPAKEGNVSADRFTAGKTRNGLVDNCLENGGRKVFLSCSVVDQWLDICLCENTAACRNGIKSLVMFGVFIEARCIGLEKRCHLVNEGTGTAGTDTIHTLLYISVFEIDDLGILASKLDSNIRLWCQLLQGSGYGDNLLYKRYFQMIGKCQSAGTCNDRTECQFTKLILSFLKKICKGFLDICKMSLIVGEDKCIVFV